MGVTNLLDFDWMDAPSAETITKSLETLYSLGALNDKGQLTKIGRRMSLFPLDPMQARVILAAETHKCTAPIITILAMLGEGNSLFFRPKDQKVAADHARARFTIKEGGDHLTLLNIFDQWEESDYSVQFCKENFIQQRSLTRARDVRDQLAKLLDLAEVQLSGAGSPDTVAIRKALVAGFFPNVGVLQRDGQTYRTLGSGATAKIHPSSVLSQERPKCILYHELVLSSAEFLRQVAPVEIGWLHEVAPHVYKAGDLEKLGMKEKTSKGKGKVGV
jgi:pre-mRNA-splicing factor ATP-dependent RNA helicase DHX16